MPKEKQSSSASEIEPYITIQRHVISSFKNGDLAKNELILYWWLRCNANPYGIVSANLDAIVSDIFPDVSTNYINQLLISLRSKRLLYYEPRQGRRGSFEVRFGEWKVPDKTYITLDKYFPEKELRGVIGTKTEPEKEATQNSTPSSKKLKDEKIPINQDQNSSLPVSEIRSAYNDKDTNKNNDLNIDNIKKTFKEIPVNEYIPSNWEEQLLHNIAKSIREPYMNYLLSAHKKVGIQVINRVWADYKDYETRGNPINAPAAYFNSMLESAMVEAKAKV